MGTPPHKWGGVTKISEILMTPPHYDSGKYIDFLRMGGGSAENGGETSPPPFKNNGGELPPQTLTEWGGNTPILEKLPPIMGGSDNYGLTHSFLNFFSIPMNLVA